jgi:ABC-type multidrug transport system ATPase subunit
VPEPLLRCSDLRVDVEGAPALDGLTLETSASHVVVLGAPRALFEAASGVRRAARGTLRVAGEAPSEAVASRLVGACPCDEPLPPAWSALELATWTSRLAGFPKGEARALARAAVDRLELRELASRPLQSVPPQARRAASLAAVLATSPRVVLIEDPLRDLSDDASRWYARVVLKALGETPWVVFASRLSLSSPLLLHAEEAVVASSSRALAQGPPAELAVAERTYVARVHGDPASLIDWLAERGGSMEHDGARVQFRLGPSLTTVELLGACADRDVTVVELLPLSRALA